MDNGKAHSGCKWPKPISLYPEWIKKGKVQVRLAAFCLPYQGLFLLCNGPLLYQLASEAMGWNLYKMWTERNSCFNLQVSVICPQKTKSNKVKCKHTSSGVFVLFCFHFCDRVLPIHPVVQLLRLNLNCLSSCLSFPEGKVLRLLACGIIYILLVNFLVSPSPSASPSPFEVLGMELRALCLTDSWAATHPQ